MCSHEAITWRNVNNSVTNRIFENPSIHKCTVFRTLRRRTKVVNAEIKNHCNVKDYREYIELKTNVLRNLIKDSDTDDCDILSDADYSAIYNSSTPAKYITQNPENIFISEENGKNYKKNNAKHIEKEKKNKANNTRIRIEKKETKNIKNIVNKKKPLQEECNTISSKECLNTGWQHVRKNNSNISRSDNRAYTNILNNKNTFEDNNCNELKAQSNNQSLSLQLESQNNTSNIIKSGNKIINQNDRDYNAADISNSTICTISNEAQSINENKNYKDQNVVTNESSTELDSQNMPYQAPLSKSILDNITNSANENTVIKLKDNKLTEARDENLINTKNCSNTYVDSKSNLLENVEKNLIVSNEIQSISENKNYKNQNVVTDESDTKLDSQNLHYQTPISKSILDNITDSANELNSIIKLDDSNKLTETCNKSLTNAKNYDNTYVDCKSSNLENVRKNLLSVLEKAESTNNDKDVKKDKNIENRLNHDHLLLPASSNRHSTPLKETQTNLLKMQNLSPDQQKDSGFDEDSQDKFVKIKRSYMKNPTSLDIVEKMPVSPRQCKNIAEAVETIAFKYTKENIKNVHLKLHDDTSEEQNNKEKEEFLEEKEKENSSQLDQDVKDVEIRSINQEDKTHFVKVKDSCDIQKQQLLSPKQKHIKNVHSKSRDNILEEQDSRKVKELSSSREEKKDFSRLNEVDKDAEIYSIDHEDETHFAEREDSCDIQDSRGEKSSEEEEVENSFQLNQIDEDADIHSTNHEEKTYSAKSEDSCDAQNQRLQSPKKDNIKDVHLKSNNNILSKQDNKDAKEEKNFRHLDQIDKDKDCPKIHSTNREDEIHVKLNDICDIQKQQLLPKVTCTQVINKKFKIINKEDNDINSSIERSDNINLVSKCTPMKNNPNISNLNIDNWQKEMVNVEEIDNNMSLILETDNEEEKRLQQQARLNLVLSSDSSETDEEYITTETSKKHVDNSDTNSNKDDRHKNDKINCVSERSDTDEDNAIYMSPQTKKRLQQQARLNLVVSSDSSETDEEYITTETSKKHVDNSDTNRNKDDRHKNDKINCVSERSDTDISRNEDIYVRKEATLVPTEAIMELNSTSTRKEINKEIDKTVPLAKCTYKNVNSFKSTTKNLLKDTQCCENVYNSDNDLSECMESVESFQLRVSESNTSQNSVKQSSLLDKENVRRKSKQCKDRMAIRTSELESSCKSGREQNEQISATRNCSNLDISYPCRPRNLQELVEDQELLVETIPPSFTLADLSEDDEAFILNIPSKLLRYNLQGQLLKIKEKTIKFGEKKYRTVHKKVGTTSCIFATGKKKKPYKIVNIKEVSTITVRERLLHRSRKLGIISSESKSTNINNRQTDETSSKMLKNLNHNKRKRKRNSDIETKEPVVKKGRLKHVVSDIETKKSMVKKRRLKVIHS